MTGVGAAIHALSPVPLHSWETGERGLCDCPKNLDESFYLGELYGISRLSNKTSGTRVALSQWH